MNPELTAINPATAEYKALLAAKNRAEAELREVNYILKEREEQIALMEPTVALVGRLQSQANNMEYELTYLQDMLQEAEQKTDLANQRNVDIMRGLKPADEARAAYETLEATQQQTSGYLQFVQKEADELAALNKQLLEELRQLPRLQSELAIEKEENRLLKAKLVAIEQQLTKK